MQMRIEFAARFVTEAGRYDIARTAIAVLPRFPNSSARELFQFRERLLHGPIVQLQNTIILHQRDH
jgi:hypothetical protein